MQDELQSGQAAAAAAAHALAQARAAYAIQQQESQQASQITATLKVQGELKSTEQTIMCVKRCRSTTFCGGILYLPISKAGVDRITRRWDCVHRLIICNGIPVSCIA